MLLRATAFHLHPMGRRKQNKRNPSLIGLTKQDREARAAAAPSAAQPSVGAQDRTRPRPNSATVTPSHAPAEKRVRACGPGASPTDSQNIAGVGNVLSWGSRRSRTNGVSPRKLFDGPITVQGSPSSRRLIQRHCGTVARSRIPFGQHCASQKLDTFKEIVEMAG